MVRRKIYGVPSSEDEGQFSHHRTTMGEIVDEMEVLGWTVEQLADALSGMALAEIERLGDGNTEDEAPTGSFGYIPISLSTFMADLRILDRALAEDPDYKVRGKRYRPVKFFEIGCGHGRNLAILRHCSAFDWLSLEGIDISSRMIELGRRAYGFDEDELRVDDAMSVDLSGADVVYTYRPFLDDKRQAKFEKHMLNSMKVSAYLVAPLAMTVSDQKRMIQIGDAGNVWKKIA